MHLPCIVDQGIDFYKEHFGTELLLPNYYNNVTVTSRRNVVNTPCYNEYVHANVTETIENEGYV